MARSSPGVRRVAAILNFLADHPGQAFTLTDLVKALKLSRATCHALLTGLVEVGYLYRASDKNYVLGPALVSIGRIAVDHASPLQVAQPEMRALADEFDVICAAFFRDKDDIVVRDRAASLSHVGWSVPVGTRLKLRPPFGAIFHAWLPNAEAEANAWLDSRSPPPTEEHRAAMAHDMAFVRRHGFSVMINNPEARHDRSPEQVFEEEALAFPITLVDTIDEGEFYTVRGITAPVFEGGGRVAFVLGLSGFTRTVSGAEIAAMGRRLVEATNRVSSFVTGTRPIA